MVEIRQLLAPFMVAREIALLTWTDCQGTQMNNCHEKYTAAMLGGRCSQHVTGNTSRLNQRQSAIM